MYRKHIIKMQHDHTMSSSMATNKWNKKNKNLYQMHWDLQLGNLFIQRLLYVTSLIPKINLVCLITSYWFLMSLTVLKTMLIKIFTSQKTQGISIAIPLWVMKVTGWTNEFLQFYMDKDIGVTMSINWAMWQ